MPFWQNAELLPSSVREKARNKPKRSKEEYAESREKVKQNVQEANEKMSNKEISAEVMLYIELNEDELKQKLSMENPGDVMQDIGSYDAKQWGQMQAVFGEANFDLQVEADDEGKPMISMNMNLPEGNVKEKIPLNQSLQEALITQAVGSATDDHKM